MKRVVVIGRSIVAITLALVIFGAPFYRQVLGGSEPWVPRWVMFSGIAVGMYGVHFEAESPSGMRRTVLWDEFDTPLPRGTRHRATRATNPHHVAQQGMKICQGLGKGHEVHAHVRLATNYGWLPLGRERFDLCNPRERRKFQQIHFKKRRPSGKRRGI